MSVQSNWNTFKPPRFNLRSSSSTSSNKNKLSQNGYTETVKKHKRSQDKIPNQSQSRYDIKHKSSTAILTPSKPPRLSSLSRALSSTTLTATTQKQSSIEQKPVISTPFTLSPTPDTMHLFDSSFSLPDAEKVEHVLEVLNMNESDYHTVVMMFRRYGFEKSTLVPVKHRHFICFDNYESAVSALNHIKHKRFKFKRVDCDIYDINMLKYVVPPPIAKTDKIITKVSKATGTETQINTTPKQIIMEKQGAMTPAQIEEEQRIKKSIATQTSADISETIGEMIKIQPSNENNNKQNGKKDKIITSKDIEIMKKKQESTAKVCNADDEIISREDIIKVATTTANDHAIKMVKVSKAIDATPPRIKLKKKKRHSRLDRARSTILTSVKSNYTKMETLRSRSSGIGSYVKNGMTYYTQPKDKEEWVEDHVSIQRTASDFVYSSEQRTLIVCECDFSFTKTIIHKRLEHDNENGIASKEFNLCATTLNNLADQWFGVSGIMNTIGSDAFIPFMKNVEECKKHCHLSFGVDATNLSANEKEWNQIEFGCKFDRILATFPRIYHHDWTRWTYKEQNKILAYNLLKCWESYLAVNGEIHWLFLGNQFYNWWVKKTLRDLGMQLAYWCKLEDERSLNALFPGYMPRDDWGNQINLKDWPMFLCSFKRVKEPMNDSQSNTVSVSTDSM